MSQPTLSGQIRKLEDELGVRLFERDGRTLAGVIRASLPPSLRPTGAGRRG